VDDYSSKLDLPDPQEIVESIDANHRQMVRCHSKNDPRYQAISGVLKQFLQEKAPKKEITLPMRLKHSTQSRKLS
jgi:hypothetical protein